MNRQVIGLCALLIAAVSATAKEVTILYTNDIESVYEPIEAYWRDDITRIGGMANVATLVDQVRKRESPTFVLDAGDIFTGSLSKATQGSLVFDLYSEIGYDAINLGNHEFEYGWQVLHRVMQRARFPVLNANIFFEASDTPFAQQYTILEKGDVRIGVIGLMGVDAFLNTMMKANREGLYVKPPIEVVQEYIDLVRDEVDLVILLTHQNRTAPMQTNKEADPQVQRGFDEDYALAGQVRGVDMIIGGHSDNGLLVPVTHPDTGTLIGMTFGQGMHVGYIRFDLSSDAPSVVSASLMPVDADKLTGDTGVKALIETARQRHPGLSEVVGRIDKQAPRLYYRESPLGNLLADLLREYSGAEIGLVPAGAIRADLEAGDVTVEKILNVFPFTDTVTVVQVTGEDIAWLVEKSLSLEYGLAQYSGISVFHDPAAAIGERVQRIQVGDEALDPARTYSLVTGSFTATGGESYTRLAEAPQQRSDMLVSAAFIEMLRNKGTLAVPATGRWTLEKPAK